MTPFITRLGFRAGALCSHQLWNQAIQVISPDDQILKHFATYDKILTQRNTNLISRNIANLKEKYKSISIEILRPERADLVDKCPAFDFFLKRLDVFMHTLYSKFRYRT